MNQPFVIADYKQYYLDTWRELLATFLGWSPLQVRRWAEESGALGFLEDPGDLFYHETPQYWIKHLLVPETLKETLSAGEVIDLEARILEAFWDEHRFHFPPGTDWRPYREKVERILAEYGAALPAAPAR